MELQTLQLSTWWLVGGKEGKSVIGKGVEYIMFSGLRLAVKMIFGLIRLTFGIISLFLSLFLIVFRLFLIFFIAGKSE